MRGNQLGEIFKEKREELKLTLEQIYLVTRIPKSDLELIESGKLGNMPVNFFTYAKLVRYANYLGLDSNVIAALYRREVIGVSKNLEANLPKTLSFNKYYAYMAKLPKRYFVIAVVFIIGTVTIFFIPIFNAVTPAELTVTLPTNASAGQTINYVTAGNSLSFEGKTSPNAKLLVNKRPIELEPGGNFTTPEIPIPNADETIIVSAINPLGVSTSITFNISKKTIIQSLEVNCIITVSKEAELKVIADGQEVYNQKYFPNDAISVKAYTSLQIVSNQDQAYTLKAGSATYNQVNLNNTWKILAGRLINVE